jgi:hypothetical protein
MGVVAGDEVDTRVHEVGDERHVAAEPVEAGDDQRRLVTLGLGQRRAQLGPIGVLAAFDLGVVGDDLAAGAPHLARDGLALRVEAKAGPALTVGTDAVVGDEGGQGGDAAAVARSLLALGGTMICEPRYFQRRPNHANRTNSALPITGGAPARQKPRILARSSSSQSTTIDRAA